MSVRPTQPTLLNQCEAIAREAVDRELRANPMWEQKYGERARIKGVQSAQYHLQYLAQAVAAGDSELFRDYTTWTRTLLASRKMPSHLLATHFKFLREVIAETVPAPESTRAGEMIEDALAIPHGELDFTCAGINHQTWYIRLQHKGRKIKRDRLIKALENHPYFGEAEKVRIDMLKRFGCLSTESNGHLSEYVPWYRKRTGEIRQWIDLSSWINGETGGYLRICTEGRNESASILRMVIVAQPTRIDSSAWVRPREIRFSRTSLPNEISCGNCRFGIGWLT